MKFTGESKFFIGIAFTTIAVISIGIMLFSRPEPTFPKSEMILSDTYTKGATDSAVYLVEFSDFQCPACKTAKPLVDGLVKEYKDKIVFAYRHFPLDQHPLGIRAAQAAEAAGAQGKFWEMYDGLFAQQDSLSEEKFIELAKTIGLDESRFTKDMDTKTFEQKVETDRLYGLRIGISATPTFFLNGKKLSLVSFNDLRGELEKATTQSGL